jgi:hypothetical protein
VCDIPGIIAVEVRNLEALLRGIDEALALLAKGQEDLAARLAAVEEGIRQLGG